MKRLFSMLVRALLVLGLVAALVLAFMLRTATGRNQVETLLLKMLPGDIRFTGLSGALPFRGRVETLTLHDEKGVWMEARGVEWTMARRALVTRQVVLRSVSVEEALLLRAPEALRRPAARTAATSGAWRVWVQHATVGDLRVGEAVVGEAVRAQLAGSFRQTASGWSAAVSASARWREENLLLVCSARQDESGATFHVRRVEADGLQLEGRGAWKPERVFEFSGVYSNSPLLTRLAGVEWSGNGHVTGRATWGAETRVAAEVSLRDGALGGISNLLADARAEWAAREGWRVDVMRAEGAAFNHPFRLLAPAQLASMPNGFRWNAPGFSWAGVAANSSGRWADDGVEAVAALPDQALADSPLARWFKGGVARAEARVTGARSNPVWRVVIEGDALDVRMHGAFQPNPAQLRIHADASSGVAQIRAELGGWTAEPLELNAELPLALSAEGRFGFDTNGPVRAELHADVQLAELGAFTDLRGAEIGGALTCDVEVGGRWAQPTVAGRIALTGGRASFPDSGAALRNVNVLLEGNRDGLVIRHARADDGAGGRVFADGHIRFDPAQKFPLAGALTLERAAVWREQGSLVRLSGRLALEGTAFAPKVTGRLDVAEAEIRLRPSPPPLPRLPIVEAEEAARPTSTEKSWLHAVTVDIGVFGSDIRVLGRGLDSSWRADLRVDRLADALRLRGGMSVERGFFLFLGRRFTLERALITLDGRRPPAPLIDLTATSRAGEMQARLFAIGPLDGPMLNLESEPAYPVDEILARLLFGRSMDAITPFQAIRLAHGLNILRGRGRTLDVLERGQSMLRVDQLELVQSDEDAAVSAISVGKYVGRNVYVEGEKSFDGSADLITVEVELTPSLILTTESSPRIREGIGLKWRRDY